MASFQKNVNQFINTISALLFQPDAGVEGYDLLREHLYTLFKDFYTNDVHDDKVVRCGRLSTDDTPYVSIYYRYSGRERLVINMCNRNCSKGMVLLSFDMATVMVNDASAPSQTVHQRKDTVLDLHDEGFTLKEIGELFGIDLTDVKSIVQRFIDEHEKRQKSELISFVGKCVADEYRYDFVGGMFSICEEYGIDPTQLKAFKFGISPINGIPYIIMSMKDNQTIITGARVIDGNIVNEPAVFKITQDEDQPDIMDSEDIDAIIAPLC